MSVVREVEANPTILFGTLDAGVTNKRENAAWEKETVAVNSVGFRGKITSSNKEEIVKNLKSKNQTQ